MLVGWYDLMGQFQVCRFDVYRHAYMFKGTKHTTRSCSWLVACCTQKQVKACSGSSLLDCRHGGMYAGGEGLTARAMHAVSCAGSMRMPRLSGGCGFQHVLDFLNNTRDAGELGHTGGAASGPISYTPRLPDTEPATMSRSLPAGWSAALMTARPSGSTSPTILHAWADPQQQALSGTQSIVPPPHQEALDLEA